LTTSVRRLDVWARVSTCLVALALLTKPATATSVTYAPIGASTGEQLEHETEPEWYGWQTAIVNAAAISAFIAAATQGEAVSMAVAASAHTLGGPAVHLGHGRVDMAAASLGVRAGSHLPLFLFPVFACSPSASADCTTGPATWHTLAMLTGTLIDKSLYAFERPKLRPVKRAALVLFPTAPAVGASSVPTAGVTLTGTW
jgi:hypothetical protein